MFKRLQSENTFTFTFDGVQVIAQPGDSVAAALLANGTNTTRITHTSATPRGPYCMMGTCYDCLVELDGTTVQSCMVQATPNLIVSRAKNIND